MFPPKLLLSVLSLKGLHLEATAIHALNFGLSVITTTQTVYSAMTSAPFMTLLLMQGTRTHRERKREEKERERERERQYIIILRRT